VGLVERIGKLAFVSCPQFDLDDAVRAVKH
jgi:hypothetical protein